MIGKDARCIAVFGRRGAGKSTLVKSLVAGAGRLVVFDPMGEYARMPGYRRAASVGEVRKILRASWGRGFRVAFVPEREHVKALHSLSALLWGAQIAYDDGRDTRKLLLVVEEANLGFPNRPMRPGEDAFLRLILQGRHRGIEIIAVTQRPALVSPNFRSNAAETYCFALSDEIDLSTMRRMVGKAREAELRAMPVHHYFRVSNGTVERGVNRLPRITETSMKAGGAQSKKPLATSRGAARSSESNRASGRA
ncbi:DNA helicase HerA-like ATPase [Constrictibacter sp. MBR-5]|uniref:helicase HerA domain-containing protein n=1 Tax=Constrictibacter sp. MBR-5 TaxID=3156467 RepID=UPI003394CD4C